MLSEKEKIDLITQISLDINQVKDVEPGLSGSTFKVPG